MNLDWNKLVDWASERWERPGTIYTLVTGLAFVLFFKFSGGKLADVTPWEWVFISSICLLLYAVWHRSVRLPCCPRDRIGVGVAIAAETKQEYQVIAADFIMTIRRLLDRQGAMHHLTLIEVPQHHARAILSTEDAERLRQRCRCHYLVWGTAKRRTLDGREKHMLNLEGIVFHARIPAPVGATFSREFTELFPREVAVDCENDVRGLEVTSEWVECVARYIIAIAAMLSGAIDYAENVFQTIRHNIDLKASPLPPIKKIRQRVPVRLGAISAHRANLAYQRWIETDDPSALDEIEHHLSDIAKLDSTNYLGRLLRAIWHFEAHRNVKAAITEIRRCRDVRHAAWRYSYAFLFAYQGQMLKARRMYKTAFAHTCDPSVPLQVEAFILRVLSREPDKVQLYYCLGLINWHGKQDLKQSRADFVKFLDAQGEEAFPEEGRLARAHIASLAGELEMVET